jgi:hypothetical protein
MATEFLNVHPLCYFDMTNEDGIIYHIGGIPEQDVEQWTQTHIKN